jgi:hypothetical protein
MLKITHDECDYSKDVEFICPKCKIPFCEEDREQAFRGLMCNHIISVDKINEIIDWCNEHKKPKETDIIKL